MKGWILVERNKPIITTNNSFEVFKTRKDIFNYYGTAMGENNAVVRIEFKVIDDD